jgi:hypothetical protein
VRIVRNAPKSMELQLAPYANLAIFNISKKEHSHVKSVLLIAPPAKISPNASVVAMGTV